VSFSASYDGEQDDGSQRESQANEELAKYDALPLGLTEVARAKQRP
jgi:hypothetical protein